MVYVPAEWEPHAAVWMAWPYREDEWADLAGAQREIAALVAAIAETERVELLVDPSLGASPDVPSGPNVRVRRVAYGDSWTRDSSCIFARETSGQVGLCFGFDGWGGKYLMTGDEDLSGRIAAEAGVPAIVRPLTLEGGAIEVDGAGALMTTRVCIEARNPSIQVGEALDQALREAFGIERIIWLDASLRNDHTDGHIDTLVRFVRPGEVLAMDPAANDPNGAMLIDLQAQLHAEGLVVHRIPSPGAIYGRAGELLAASYTNYYLANDQVIVPTYGSRHDDDAVAAIAALFPGRRTRGLPAKNVLEGGGAFHCITQQQPVDDAQAPDTRP
ncbi:MAG: agmatine deiminase family protein [Myxococcales bacterium]|nr:agmatine deiminase family protein [Myxococcales bacterium]